METNDLRKAGLKITLPRLKILEILGTAVPRYMSAEDIYKHLLESHEDISLATVYRVLTQFEAAGLVTRHHFEGILSWPPWWTHRSPRWRLPSGRWGAWQCRLWPV